MISVGCSVCCCFLVCAGKHGEQRRSAAPTLRDYLRACGIGDSDFARFADDRQMADEELDVVRRIAIRLRDCPADVLGRLAAPADVPSRADAKDHRGQVVRLRGRIESVEPVEETISQPANTHISDPIRLARMVNKVEWLENDIEKEFDPHGLAPWVKEAARLPCETVVAAQPDSPSRQAGWGQSWVAFRSSCPASFTIQASWMGSPDYLCATTRRV